MDELQIMRQMRGVVSHPVGQTDTPALGGVARAGEIRVGEVAQELGGEQAVQPERQRGGAYRLMIWSAVRRPSMAALTMPPA